MGKKEVVVLLTGLLLLHTLAFSVSAAEYNLTYDGNGNLIQSVDEYFEYNDFNQLERVKANDMTGSVIVEYSYGSDGQRIRKQEYDVDSGGNNRTTYYVDKSFIHVAITNGTSYNETYYYDSRDLVAKGDNDGAKTFYHSDHLSSTNLVTNESGDIVEEIFYLPYGEVLEGGDDRFLFTGKEKDAETGLSYYGARYYDSYLRHFTQPDNVLPEIYDPQQLNRYSYARNNPYSYVDPSGNSPTLVTAAIGYVAGYAIGGLYSAVSQYYNTGSVNVLQVGISAGSFGIAGGVAGLTLGLGPAIAGTGYGGYALGGSIAGFSGGRAGQLGSNVLNEQPLIQNLFNPADIVLETAGGAALGAGGKYVSNLRATSKLNFADGDGLTQHFMKHKGEFGFTSKQQYLKSGRKFLVGESKADTLQYTRPNGDLVRFDPKENTFGVRTENNIIRTYMKPKGNGENYFNADKEKHLGGMSK